MFFNVNNIKANNDPLLNVTRIVYNLCVHSLRLLLILFLNLNGV